MSNKYCCLLASGNEMELWLVLLWKYIRMHGPMNVRSNRSITLFAAVFMYMEIYLHLPWLTQFKSQNLMFLFLSF